MTDESSRDSVCVIVPAFNEAVRIRGVLEKIRALNLNVVVVDDGSTDGTADIATGLGAAIVRHASNLGKGASLVSGFHYVREHGYEIAITIDADGQHEAAEIPQFIDAYRRTGIPVLVGNRMWDKAKMPLVRRWTNSAMSWVISRIMGIYLPDTQCGFRLYRADILPYLPVGSARFAMESEILLMIAGRGFRVDSVRISTIYAGQKSRINPVVDTFRFAGMLLRYYRDQRVRRS